MLGIATAAWMLYARPMQLTRVRRDEFVVEERHLGKGLEGSLAHRSCNDLEKPHVSEFYRCVR